MRHFLRTFFGVLSVVCLMAVLVSAEAKVEQQPLGPDGESIGGAVSPHGSHAAVLVSKGSRFIVLIDGVAGPRIDALLNNVTGGAVSGTYWIGKIPVAFSNDGAHSAYVGQVGDQYIVVYDGKELTRGPLRSAGQITIGLSFSNNGKHFYYMDQDDAGLYRIVADGKPGPGSSQPPQLVLSPDGDHYAYVGYPHNGGGPPWAVVDGRQVNFFGDHLQYTGRNVLVSLMNESNANILVLNGKPAIKAYQLNPMWISPDGAQIAIVITPKNGDPGTLMVDGKLIPGTEGVPVLQMYFSPNGKRWAALCRTRTGLQYMIIDGKKGSEYQGIPQSTNPNLLAHWTFVTGNTDLMNGTDSQTIATFQPVVPGFTPDSSKFVYMASQGGRAFMVVEDEESDGFQGAMTPAPILSETGRRIGLIAVAPNQMQHLIIDDKDISLSPFNVPNVKRASLLVFSPGSAHYVFLDGSSFDLDGVVQPGFVTGIQCVFSPDDKHFAYPATVADHPCFVIDGKVVDNNATQVNFAFFSPDSRHIIWCRGLATPGSKDFRVLFVDGKPVTHFAEGGGGLVPHFEFSSDGVMTFVARTDESFRRFRVTMPADSNIDTLLAAAKEPAGK